MFTPFLNRFFSVIAGQQYITPILYSLTKERIPLYFTYEVLRKGVYTNV